MTVVGIGHLSRAGKDSAATALQRDLGYRRIGFADKLKELALECDPLVTTATQASNVGAGRGRLKWVVHGLTWEGAKDSYPEVRNFLINLGEGCRKVLDSDIWVNAVLDGVKKDENVVIPDVRYENEAEAIQKAGGFVIRIDRPGATPSGLSDNYLTDWDGWDAVIVNDGTVQDLERAIVSTVKELTSDD